MKTTFLIISVIGCVALSLLGGKLSKELDAKGKELAAANQQVAALQAELKDKEEAIERARTIETKSTILQKTLAESTSAAVAESRKSEKLQQSLDQAKTNNPLRAVASMMKSPEMRDMIKSQQQATLGPIINREYSDFVKQLNMTPEQSKAFMDLEMKKMLGNTDAGLSLLDDSLDASQRADLAKQVKDQADAVNAEIKQLLGDDNYKAYQGYEKTLPDRLTMNQLNDQLAGTGTPLTSDQQTQLMQVMSEARSSFTWTSTLNQRDANSSADIASMLTQDNIDKYVAEHEQFDQQILSRAQQILTPDQLTAFQKYQKSQRDMQVLSMKMAGQLMGK
jgi:hypothetical protein